MKNVICLLGSPRPDGTSATISDKILETAKSLGAQTQRIVLNELTYKGCQACMACKTNSEKCVVRDDLAPILDAIREADVLIAASPIYFGDVTGQLKSAIDRMYSFLKPDYLSNPDAGRLAPGKRCVFVLTQGSPDETSYDVYPNYGKFFRRFGFETYVIRGLGLRDKADAVGNADLMSKAEELAKTLLA